MAFGEILVNLLGILNCIHFLAIHVECLDNACYVGYVLHNYAYQYLSVNVDSVGSEAVCDFYICSKISVSRSRTVDD